MENYEKRMKFDHEMQIQAHETAYGAPLGQLRVEPTQEQLDSDFKDREAEGSLLSQSKRLGGTNG